MPTKTPVCGTIVGNDNVAMFRCKSPAIVVTELWGKFSGESVRLCSEHAKRLGVQVDDAALRDKIFEATAALTEIFNDPSTEPPAVTGTVDGRSAAFVVKLS